jgi:DNA-binding MurR/RpiR family transcriptional regulator
MRDLPASATATAAAVRGLLPSLTPAAARIAELILEDPARVAQCTISELGVLAGTSESTIVRTARALGFSGYPELRLALAAAGASRGGDRMLTADIAPDDVVADVVAKIAHAESQALQDTAAQLDTEALEHAIEAVCQARRVDIYGVAASGLVAADLQQKLMRIGRGSHALTDVHLALTSAALLTAGDVAIAVSHSGETVDVIEPTRMVHDGGATTIAITSNPRSTLATLVDHVLLTGMHETTFRPGALASRISQLLVVDCLFVGVAQRTYDESMRALVATHEALATRHHRPARRGR